jgi:hypothetical protein
MLPTPEVLAQRLHAQAAQQLARLRRRFPFTEHHGAEAARVVQAQHALRGHEVEVVVQRGFGQARVEAQAAGHAQVHQQQAAIQVQQQVLPAAADGRHRAAHQGGGVAAERPAQGLAHADFLDAGADDAVGETEARDLDFRQFGHGDGWAYRKIT